ncbi:MAG: hypothetical protein LBH30_06190 [Prevotellaceae bacterium]|nr:hypothetical protein [Prevotellaceae bacterium]
MKQQTQARHCEAERRSNPDTINYWIASLTLAMMYDCFLFRSQFAMTTYGC